MSSESTAESEETIVPDKRSLLGVLLSTALVSFNDNFIKILVISVTVKVAAGQFLGDFVTEILVVLGLLAYLIFSPTAGFVADKKAKSWLLRVTMIAQAILFIWMVASLILQSPVMAIAGFFLLSVQSTFFSPAKIGILKEVAGHAGLARAMGLSNTVNMLAIIAGIWVAGPMFDGLLSRLHNPWESALYPIILMGVLSFIALGVLRMIREGKPQGTHPFTPSILWAHFQDLKLLHRDKPIRLAAFGVSMFWGLSFFVSILMVDIGLQVFPGEAGGAATVTSNLAAVLGIGTALGSLACAAVSREGNELGLVPAGAIIIVIALVGAGLSTLGGALFYLAMMFCGVGGGLLLVPLYTVVQDMAKPDERGTLLAALNLQDCLAGLGATLLAVFLKLCRVPISAQLILIALPMAAMAWYVLKILPGNLLRVIALMVIRILYRVKCKGVDTVPKEGPVLLVANHITFADAFVMGSCLERKVHFLVYEDYMNKPGTGWILKRFGAIPISSTKAREAIRTAVDLLKSGEVVSLFPEGQLTRTGLTGEIRKGVELIARQSGCSVIPVWLGGLWGSVFSFSGGHFFWKKPARRPRPVSVRFGAPLEPKEVTSERLRRVFQDLSKQSWKDDTEACPLRLPSVLEKSLRRDDSAVFRVVHASGEVFPLSGKELWELSGRLATKWAREMKGRRVAVALRPGRGAAVGMLALLRLGKTPVILDTQAMENLDEISALLSRLKLDQLVCQNNWMPRMVGSVFSKGLVLLDEDLLRLDQEEPLEGPAAAPPLPEEAVMTLVKEGDVWEARGQSQETILRNVVMIDTCDFFRPNDLLASNLPLSHPAGLVFSLFLPMISGRSTLLAPSGGDSRTLNDVLRDQKVTVFLTEPGSARVLRKFQAMDHRTSSLRHLSSWVTDTQGGNEDVFSADGEPGQGLVSTRSLAIRENGCLAAISFPNPTDGAPGHETQYGWRKDAFGHPFPDLEPPDGENVPWTKFAPPGLYSPVFDPLIEDGYGLLTRLPEE